MLIYKLSSQIPKRDRFGIWLRIENVCLEISENIISASYSPKPEKLRFLVPARLNTEILKRLIRTTRELNIITEEMYLKLESELQEISKMISGWIKYSTGTS